MTDKKHDTDKVPYDRWFPFNRDWLRDNALFMNLSPTDKCVLLGLYNNIIRIPDRKFTHYHKLNDLGKKGFRPTNVGQEKLALQIKCDRHTIKNSIERLKAIGVVYEIPTKKTSNYIYIVGFINELYGELLFIDSVQAINNKELKPGTISYIKDNYTDSDFFSRKNENDKTIIQVLFPEIYNKIENDKLKMMRGQK